MDLKPSAATTIKVYGDGTHIGFLMNTPQLDQDILAVKLFTGELIQIRPDGTYYPSLLAEDTKSASTTYFDQENCTGNRYIALDGGGSSHGIWNLSKVAGTTTHSELFKVTTDYDSVTNPMNPEVSEVMIVEQDTPILAENTMVSRFMPYTDPKCEAVTNDYKVVELKSLDEATHGLKSSYNAFTIEGYVNN